MRKQLINWKRIFYAAAVFAVLEHVHAYFGVATQVMIVGFVAFCVDAAITTLILDFASYHLMRAIRRLSM